MKHCTHCHEPRQESEFRIIRKDGKEFRDSWCRFCHRAYAKAYRERTSSKVIEPVRPISKMRIKLPNGANYEIIG